MNTIQNKFKPPKRHSGYFSLNAGLSLVELIVTVAILGILASVAAPNILNWLPNLRLKNAARDVYSTFQKARLLAVKQNVTVRVRFDTTVNPGFYFIDIDNSGTVNQPDEYQMNLSAYGSGVNFGFPAGLVDWNGGAIATSVTFPGGPPRFCTYNSNGTSGAGTIYLVNSQASIVYAITTVTSGAVKMRKYNGILPFHKRNWIE
ncbi:MAG: prepilin-type N-terminal cleavage/methylation domain-containing protein [Proteobacteria bacterium]|nr:prepilin-type N-terminal cleavage/methylation domain-containing protein [Desulfobulbaceae bacterium]MBU4153401.1 prepilin-type N-terminal cleavage/methylation domain-containing protein [Pseudomonadota bacterium]MDP2107261.1 prepilin-type N-terminal cleavage/methylation domain-containing protein [Desulfobulbaceae bacterium]